MTRVDLLNMLDRRRETILRAPQDVRLLKAFERAGEGLEVDGDALAALRPPKEILPRFVLDETSRDWPIIRDTKTHQFAPFFTVGAASAAADCLNKNPDEVGNWGWI